MAAHDGPAQPARPPLPCHGHWAESTFRQQCVEARGGPGVPSPPQTRVSDLAGRTPAPPLQGSSERCWGVSRQRWHATAGPGASCHCQPPCRVVLRGPFRQLPRRLLGAQLGSPWCCFLPLCSRAARDPAKYFTRIPQLDSQSGPHRETCALFCRGPSEARKCKRGICPASVTSVTMKQGFTKVPSFGFICAFIGSFSFEV